MIGKPVPTRHYAKLNVGRGRLVAMAATPVAGITVADTFLPVSLLHQGICAAYGKSHAITGLPRLSGITILHLDLPRTASAQSRPLSRDPE